MKTWNCPKKTAARNQTLLHPCPNQYWSMAGLCTTPNCEVEQMLQYIEPWKFHGVEIRPEIYEANVAAWPELSWHLGDFFQVMRMYSGFNPSIVNADMLQTADTAAEYIAQIMYLLLPFEVTLVANFVMEHRGIRHMPKYVLTKLASCQPFRYSMRSGFRLVGCYQYPGTGERSQTSMGSFIFNKGI